MKYKALFLDLDGTILSTLKDIAEAVNYALDVFNLPKRSIKEVRSFTGNGSNHLITMAMGENYDKELFKKVFATYKTYYLNHYADYTQPYPFVLEVLKEFKDKGGKIALISNKPHDLSIKLLEKFFPGLFDTIYGQMDNVKRKPDPMSVYLAMDDLNLTDKKDILFVGDSLVDLKTSQNANIDVILCTYGLTDENIIRNAHKHCINNFKELRGYLY